jgi:predicted outer membrane lipoprotein
MVSGAGGSVTVGMRRMLWVAAGLVLVQGSILLAAHNDTSRYFSWTIAVPLTAAFLGAGYLSAAVLESMAARQGSWQRARIAVPGVLAFTTLTLAVTLVHLNKFHLGVASGLTRALTWGWLAIYVGVPPVLAFLWWRQARAVPRAASAGPHLPPLVRAVLGVQGAVMLVLGVAMLAAPVQVARLWPWPLTALTGRAVGAWLVGLGIIAAQSWYADRREVAAIAFWAIAVYSALQLVVLAGFARSMHWDQAPAWCYLLFLASLLAVGMAGVTSVTKSG